MIARTETTEAERLRAELDQLLQAAGHDLAEPARTIRGFLELLERRHGAALADDAREFIGFAVDAAARLDAMLAGLLELGRVGRSEPPATPVDAAAVAGEAAAPLRGRLAALGGSLAIGPLPAWHGDAKLWRRLFGILIDNALTYRASRPPAIEISGDGHGITVADNGIGIAPEFHARIFEPFQRLHTRDAIAGVGMGLAIARKIAERHGARLEVASRPGAGSQFMILPGPRPRADPMAHHAD